MDELPKNVLYAFYPDRILRMDEVVKLSKTSLPFARNTINKLLIPEKFVREVDVVNGGGGQEYFQLTGKGATAVKQIHKKREWMRNRLDELVNSGMSKKRAAIQVAVESVSLSDLV